MEGKISDSEKFEIAQKYKKYGNEYFKQKDLRPAISKYHRALIYLKGIGQDNSILAYMGLEDDTESESSPAPISQTFKDQVAVLQADCYNNLAACLLQKEDPQYSRVIEYCDSVLQVSPCNAKALYRKGLSLYYLKQYEKAQDVLCRARDSEQGAKDPIIKKYIALCKKETKIQDQEMKKTCQSMFSKNTGTGNTESG